MKLVQLGKASNDVLKAAFHHMLQCCPDNMLGGFVGEDVGIDDSISLELVGAGYIEPTVTGLATAPLNHSYIFTRMGVLYLAHRHNVETGLSKDDAAHYSRAMSQLPFPPGMKDSKVSEKLIGWQNRYQIGDVKVDLTLFEESLVLLVGNVGDRSPAHVDSRFQSGATSLQNKGLFKEAKDGYNLTQSGWALFNVLV